MGLSFVWEGTLQQAELGYTTSTRKHEKASAIRRLGHGGESSLGTGPFHEQEWLIGMVATWM